MTQFQPKRQLTREATCRKVVLEGAGFCAKHFVRWPCLEFQEKILAQAREREERTRRLAYRPPLETAR